MFASVRLCLLALAVSTIVLAAESKVTATSDPRLQLALFLEADANALDTGPGPKVKQSNDLVKSSSCIRCQNGGVPSTDCRKCNCRAPFTGDRCQSKNKGVAFNGHFLDNEFIKACKITRKECSEKTLRVTEDVPVPALLFVKEASVGKKNWMLQLERLSISLFDFMPPSSMSISATKDQVAKLVKDEDVLLVTKLPPSVKIDQALANGFVAALPDMQTKHPDSAASNPPKHHSTPAPGGNTQSVLLSVKFGLLGTVDDPASPPAPRGVKIVAEINNAIDERNKKLLSENKPILVAEVLSHTETTVIIQSRVADAASIAALLSLRPQITSISRLEPFEISTRLQAENLNALYTKALAESLRKRRNAYGHAVGQRGSFDNTDGLAAALGAAGKNYPIFERQLTGKRQVIGVADTGLDYHHCAFSAMEDVNAGVLIVRDIKLRLNAPDDREYDISVQVKPAQSANAKIGAATYSNIVKHTSGSKPASGVSAERHFPVPLHFDVPTNVDLAEFTVTVREVRPDAGGTEDHMVKADDQDITVKRDSNFFGLYLDAIKLSAFATAEGRALTKLEVRNAADTAQYGELDLTLAFRPKPDAKIARYFGAWGDYGDYSGGHGTHVVGSIAGHPPDNSISAKHRGGSPDASIVFFDLENDRYEDGGSGFIAFEATDVLGKLRASGARIISNSYNGGSDAVQKGRTAPYNGPVGAIDEWIFKHKDTVVLWSAGNQGWNWNAPAGPRARSILHEGNSKNALVVGAAAAPLEAWKERHKYMTSGCRDAFTKLGQDPWTKSCSDVCAALASAHHPWPAPMADFSGRGPLDGSPNRFKPDIGVTGQFAISPRAGRRGNSDLNGDPEVGNSCAESTNVLVWSAGSILDNFISSRGVLWDPPTTETYYHFREATPNNRLGKIYFRSSYGAHDLSALEIQIAFEARLAPSPTPHAHGCDKILLEYSTDGATWITLHEAKPDRDKWSDYLVIIDASNNAGARHATTSLRFNQPCSVPRKEGEQTVSVRRLLISERTGNEALVVIPEYSLRGAKLVSSRASSTRRILVLQGVKTAFEKPMVFSPDLYLPHGGRLRVEYAFCGDPKGGSLDLQVYPVIWNAARGQYIPQRAEVLAPERRWKYIWITIGPSNEPQRIAIVQNNNQRASADYERAVCLTASLYADRLDERGLLVDMAGTSMATPVAAGLMGLVRQYYTDGFVPLGKQHFGLGFSPSGALMKGTLMHAANSDPGSATKDQDGFGRPALKDVLAFSSPATDHDLIVRKTDRIFTFNQEGTEHLALRFRAANTADIKASISYYDIADGAIGAMFARLDLKMIQADQPNGHADKEKTPHNAWNPDDNNFKYVQYRPTANNEHHHMVVELNTLTGKDKPLYKTHPLSYAIVVTGRGLTFEMHTYHVIVQFAAKYRSAVANPPERTCTITVPGSNERHSFLCGEEFNSYNLWTNKPLGSIASITLSYPAPLSGRDDPREVVMHNVFSGTTMVADYCREDATKVPQDELQVKCELSSFNKAFRRVADVLTTKLESIYDVTFWSSSEQPDLLVDNDFKVEFRIHDEAHGTYPVKISRRRDLARETVTRLEVRGPPLGNVLADKFFMKIVPNDCVPPPAQWLIRKVRVHDLSTGHLYHAVMDTEAAGTINQEGFKQINLVRFVPNRHCYYCIHALMRARTSAPAVGVRQSVASWVYWLYDHYAHSADSLVAATCGGQAGLAKESCIEVVRGDVVEAIERAANQRAPNFVTAASTLMQAQRGETQDQIRARAVETCDTLFSGCDAYNDIDVTDLTRPPGDPFNRGQHEVYTAFSAFYR